MTVVVGIVDSLGGIIFASDSQNTEGNIKRSDAQKISIIEFANTTILIAEAGDSGLSGRAVDAIRESAKGKQVTSEWEIADTVQEAVQMVRSIMLAGYPAGTSVEDLQRYIIANCSFTLLFGCLLGSEPKLFQIDNSHQVAQRIQRHYATIGVGSELAEHLLSEYCSTKEFHSYTLASALWIVAKVKESVAGCGGPTQIASLSPNIFQDVLDTASDKPVSASIYDPPHVKYLEDKLAPLEAKSKTQRAESIEAVFDEIAREAEEEARGTSSR